MSEIIGAFNNRELVVIFWSLLVLVFALKTPGVRKAVFSLFKKLLSTKKVLIPFGVIYFYLVFAIYTLYQLGFWEFYLLKDTVTWLLGATIVMIFNSISVNSIRDFYQITIKRSLEWIVIYEFIVNLYILPIYIEFILIPILVLAYLMILVIESSSKHSVEYRQVKTLAYTVMIIIVSVMTIFAIYNIFTDLGNFMTHDTFKLFVLPILLTVALMPALYVFTLYTLYDDLFSTINTYKGQNSFKIKIECFKKCLSSISNINKMQRYLAEKLTNSTTKDEAIGIIQNFGRK